MEYQIVYVAMIIRVDEEGKFRPIAIEWHDGRRFTIDKIKKVIDAPSNVGMILTKRYDVIVEGYPKSIFYHPESNRWL